MSITFNRVEFQLWDGRILACEFYINHWPGTYFEPPEDNAGEPTYYLDGEELGLEDMPKGLDVVAEAMYEDPCSYKHIQKSENYDPYD